MMVSIGHRTGLFDYMAELPASRVEDIASHAGLDCRYVKEWLGAMVSGGIVKYQPADQQYLLPESHASLLTRKASPHNIAVFARYVSVLGQVEDNIVDCFRTGGGVGYEHYPRFHQVMAEDSCQTVLAGLEKHILPLVGHIIPKLEQGIRLLDIGCGRGRALLHLAQHYPNSEFVGYDLSKHALQQAREEAEAEDLVNVRLMERDLTEFGVQAEPRQFDGAQPSTLFTIRLRRKAYWMAYTKRSNREGLF